MVLDPLRYCSLYYVPPALTFKNSAICSHAVSYGSQKMLSLVSHTALTFFFLCWRHGLWLLRTAELRDCAIFIQLLKDYKLAARKWTFSKFWAGSLIVLINKQEEYCMRYLWFSQRCILGSDTVILAISQRFESRVLRNVGKYSRVSYEKKAVFSATAVRNSHLALTVLWDDTRTFEAVGLNQLLVLRGFSAEPTPKARL